jgi:hypothetical protein
MLRVAEADDTREPSELLDESDVATTPSSARSPGRPRRRACDAGRRPRRYVGQDGQRPGLPEQCRREIAAWGGQPNLAALPRSIEARIVRPDGFVFAPIRDGFMIELTYGPDVDWHKNIVAAGDRSPPGTNRGAGG